MLYGKFVDNVQNKQELKYSMVNGVPYLVIGSFFGNPLTSSEAIDNVEGLEAITPIVPEKIVHSSLNSVYYGSGVKVLPADLCRKVSYDRRLTAIELGFVVFTSQRISLGSHTFKPFGFAIGAWLHYLGGYVSDGLVLQSSLVNSDCKWLSDVAVSYDVKLFNGGVVVDLPQAINFDFLGAVGSSKKVELSTMDCIIKSVLNISKYCSMNVGDGVFFAGCKINIDDVDLIEINFGELSGKISISA